MKQLQYTVSHWDNSFFIVSNDLSLVCEEKAKKLILGFEKNEILLIEEVAENILEVIQILKCGPVHYKELSESVELELPQSLSFKKFLQELCNAEVIKILEKGDPLNYLHNLTDDFIFREEGFKTKKNGNISNQIKLPNIMVERKRNHSQRSFQNKPLNLKELATLLCYSVGSQEETQCPATSDRVIPSAGGIYGVDILVFANNIKNLVKGVYFYNKDTNSLSLLTEGDIPFTDIFYTKHIDYDSSSCVISYICDLEDYMWRYGKRGYRFALIEAGHCAQSLLLEAKKQEVFCVPVGAHKEKEILDFVKEDISVLYSVVCGKL